jgi:hypothetical protein
VAKASSHFAPQVLYSSAPFPSQYLSHTQHLTFSSIASIMPHDSSSFASAMSASARAWHGYSASKGSTSDEEHMTKLRSIILGHLEGMQGLSACASDLSAGCEQPTGELLGGEENAPTSNARPLAVRMVLDYSK